MPFHGRWFQLNHTFYQQHLNHERVHQRAGWRRCVMVPALLDEIRQKKCGFRQLILKYELSNKPGHIFDPRSSQDLNSTPGILCRLVDGILVLFNLV